MAIYNKPDENVFASSARQGEVSNFPDIGRGWGISFDQTGGIPPMEWFNFLFKRTDEKFGYLFQRGLSEWSATQTYPEGALVQYKNLTYKAKKANTNKKPDEAQSSDWQRWGFTQSELKSATLTESGITQLLTSINSDDETKSATPKSVKMAYDKGVEAKTAAYKAQQTANDGVSRAGDAYQRADEANNNANNRVSKLGGTVLGILHTVGITSKQFGVGSYNSQYDSGAPFMVEETGSKDRETYHPFVKGRVRSNNHYGAALSLGYTTKQGTGDGFGSGIILLSEDNGKQRIWGFEHNGDFLSAGDVKTVSGASLNGALKSNQISHATSGAAKNKVASEYALGELNKELALKEQSIWQGSSNNAVTVRLPFANGVIYVCVTKSTGAGTIDNLWLSAPISNCHNTSIGDQDAGGTAGDYNFSMEVKITKSGNSVTLTPSGARKPIIKKVVVVGV